MRLKLATRISARQFRRNPSLQALVEEATERYKETRKQSNGQDAAVRVVERVVYRDPPPSEPAKLPNGWFRRIANNLGAEQPREMFELLDEMFPPDAPRSELTGTHKIASLRRLLEDLDRVSAAVMAVRDELRRKMLSDTQDELRERERQR